MDKINKIIKRKNYYSIYKSSLACFRAKEVISKCFPDLNIKIISIKNNTLKLKANNMFEANEIKMKKNQILENLNKKIPSGDIKRVSIL